MAALMSSAEPISLSITEQSTLHIYMDFESPASFIFRDFVFSFVEFVRFVAIDPACHFRPLSSFLPSPDSFFRFFSLTSIQRTIWLFPCLVLPIFIYASSAAAVITRRAQFARTKPRYICTSAGVSVIHLGLLPHSSEIAIWAEFYHARLRIYLPNARVCALYSGCCAARPAARCVTACRCRGRNTSAADRPSSALASNTSPIDVG